MTRFNPSRIVLSLLVLALLACASSKKETPPATSSTPFYGEPAPNPAGASTPAELAAATPATTSDPGRMSTPT